MVRFSERQRSVIQSFNEENGENAWVHRWQSRSLLSTWNWKIASKKGRVRRMWWREFLDEEVEQTDRNDIPFNKLRKLKRNRFIRSCFKKRRRSQYENQKAIKKKKVSLCFLRTKFNRKFISFAFPHLTWKP